ISSPLVIKKAEGKQFILVDHSSYTQAIEGMKKAKVLGILDHHGIGDIETTQPINIRSAAVGATATANTRLSNGVPNSAGTELCDVYPFVVMTEECYGDVILRGKDAIRASVFMPGDGDKSDPLGQRGVCGASTYFAAVRLNEQQMAIGECAVSSL
ncbi:MAG: DHH family phosphoesterase, partial [Aquincola sp.]|nr:DHH family phosphoesterase [Aquincola sp.]